MKPICRSKSFGRLFREDALFGLFFRFVVDFLRRLVVDLAFLRFAAIFGLRVFFTVRFGALRVVEREARPAAPRMWSATTGATNAPATAAVGMSMAPFVNQILIG